ncbi:DUF4153 domain-containing protein [Pigmentiphaga aceris]|uniref:DUF4153 domain-containing protein n=1 Tax=Pigmentiphaga aceris TaxID=1940612 RepID=A0A5C0B2F0_9BURK|nr:DUF4153 domain-containing protein [Pigmentiphaga aceris]QEI06777.1 DUF4153 domain-containing protein [Pigmentiphaga aceris]
MPIVMRRMALIGLVQGVVLWVLATLVDGKHWPSDNMAVLLGLVYTAVAIPAAWYLSEDVAGVSKQRRRVVVIALGVGLGLLGVCEGWVNQDVQGPFKPGPSLPACIALGFVALPLLLHAGGRHTDSTDRRTWGWNYADLFQTTWRNAMVLAITALLTGIFWVVLLAGGHLMKSIGITLVLDLIGTNFFISLASSIVVSCAAALALSRTDTIVVLRRFWLSLNQAFLPLVLLFSTMWAVALPFTGVEPLFQTRRAALVLLWFAVLAINFVNAARQDGLAPAPFVPWLRRALAYAWLTMLVVVAVAALAIYQRVAQYGWTADRVWSVFVLLMAAGYAIGYSLSVFKPVRGWMWSIDQTNVAMAIVLCVGLLALASPLADARRISVASQLDRLLAGKTALDDFDFYYLKYRSGTYGTRAMQAMIDGIPGHAQADMLSKTAQLARDGKLRSGNLLSPANMDDSAMRSKLKPVNDQTSVPPAVVDALIAHLRTESGPRSEDICAYDYGKCSVWMADLDGDDKQEVVLIVNKSWQHVAQVFNWQPDTATLTYAGEINGVTQTWIDGLGDGTVTFPQSKWRDINAGGVQLRVTPPDTDR